MEPNYRHASYQEDSMKGFYAVAHMNYFDNELNVDVVHADGFFTAIAVFIEDTLKDTLLSEWYSSLCRKIATSESDHDRWLDEVKEHFFDSDQLIAVKEIGAMCHE